MNNFLVPSLPMPLSQTKNSYHPYVLVAYYLNSLPEEILSAIPRSTRFDWCHRDIAQSFGYDWFKENEEQFDTLKLVAQNRKLPRLNKVFLRVIAIKRFFETHASALRAGRSNLKRVAFNSIQKLTALIGVTQTLRYLNLSSQYYNRLKTRIKCYSSALSLCRIKHPSQLLSKEISVIKGYCLLPQYQFWPISSIYCQMIKDRAGHMNLSTFYKYVSLLNLKRSKAISRRKNHEMGIRASSVFEILHADLTEIKTEDHQKAYVYLVQDNYSRAILSHTAPQERRAVHTLENLAKVKEGYLLPAKIKALALLTDDRSENYGEAKKWMVESENPKINHLIAQLDIPFSNSMIEAAHKQLKYGFLYHHSIKDFRELLVFLALAIADYNNRPQHVLGGLAPMEVLRGKVLDREAENKLLVQARQLRTAENQKMKCCTVG